MPLQDRLRPDGLRGGHAQNRANACKNSKVFTTNGVKTAYSGAPCRVSKAALIREFVEFDVMLNRDTASKLL